MDIYDFLQTLASTSITSPDDKEYIAQCFDQRVKHALHNFAFELAYEEFRLWLNNLIVAEPPPSDIQALYFGIFETEGVCRLYVSGAITFEPNDSDWACTPGWWPERRYSPAIGLPELWRQLGDSGDQQWVAIQAVVITVIKWYFKHNYPAFQQKTGLHQLAVATGFDDGDVYVLNVSSSTKTL